MNLFFYSKNSNRFLKKIAARNEHRNRYVGFIVFSFFNKPIPQFSVNAKTKKITGLYNASKNIIPIFSVIIISIFFLNQFA